MAAVRISGTVQKIEGGYHLKFTWFWGLIQMEISEAGRRSSESHLGLFVAGQSLRGRFVHFGCHVPRTWLSPEICLWYGSGGGRAVGLNKQSNFWLCLRGTMWGTPGKLFPRRGAGPVQSLDNIYLRSPPSPPPAGLLLLRARTVIHGTVTASLAPGPGISSERGSPRG